MQPVLDAQSTACGGARMSWSYIDADTRMTLCAGSSNCTGSEQFCWGSTTKVLTSSTVLKLTEQRRLNLDHTLEKQATAFLQQISKGSESVAGLFGVESKDLTLRDLLSM